MAVLIRDQPHRSCATKTNAISVEGLSEEIHESPLSSHSREHIFNILHLLDVSAENDVLHLPSVEQRQSATVKEDFVTSDGFRRVQSLFWKGVKGWIKILLPSWSLPQDKVLKDLFQLPSGPFEDMHVAEVDASHDHSEDKVDHSLVTASIIKSLKHEKTYRTMNARFFLAPLGGCGKKQSARAGIDYIKVNFHLDNFEIVDKIIDTVAPVTDTDQEQRDEILRQKGLVFDFISYGYAHHVRKGVLTQYKRKNSTAYLTFDFKQKFLSKGFREGGDAYYGKKGMLWFGVAAFVKNQNSLHVMMPFEAIPDDGKEVDDSLNEGDRVIEGDSDGVDESDRVDEGDRVNESDRVDESDTVDESDRVDESDKVDESDRVDESDKVDESDRVDESGRIDEDESDEVNEDDGSDRVEDKGNKDTSHSETEEEEEDRDENRTRVSVRGANLRLKDSLMRTFGATWKQARIEGVVVEKPKKNCRRVKWTIGSETCVSDHSVAFWKKLSQQQVVTPPVTSDIAAFPDGLTGEEEPDEHQRERTLLEDEPDELDVSEAISTLGQGVTEQDLLCAHGQKWSLLEGTSLAYGCNTRELWGTKDDGFCPPFNLGSRFNLARDRYLSWKRYLKLWPPIILGIPSLRKIARKPQGIGIEYKNLADAETGIDCNGKEGLL
eukprot:Em0019g9a